MEKRHNDVIDFGAVLRDYLKHWYWFVISVALCGLVAVVYIKTHPTKYSVEANVLISTDETGGLPSFSGLSDLFGGDASVDDEIFLIESHSVFKEVARDMGLERYHRVKDGMLASHVEYFKYPVEVIAPAGLADPLSTSIVFRVNVDKDGHVAVEAKAKRKTLAEIEGASFPVTVKTVYGTFVVDTTQYFVPGKKLRTDITYSSYDGAAEDMAEEVSASIASRKSNVIALGINTPIPDYGKALLNNIIAKYNERGVADKNIQGEQTLRFLDSRIGLLALDLDTAETVVQDYKEAKGILDVSTEAAYNMGVKSTTARELVGAQMQLEILGLAKSFLSSPGNEYSMIPYISNMEGVEDAITAYNETVLKLMQLQANAKGENAMLRQLRQQIDAMRNNIITTLSKAYDNQNVIVGELQAQLDKAEAKLSGIPAQERQYVALKRQQIMKQQLYIYLLEKREETAIMIANSVAKGIIIDEAFTRQKPVSMSKSMILLVAVFMGMMIPPCLLYARRLFRTKFSSREEFEPLTDLPVIGEVCTDKSGETLVVTPSSTTSTAELFRLIRANLQFVLNGKDDKVVLMTSTSSGEGKSFISINLAASLALLGKRVLLVGMDIRNPRLAEYLGLPPSTGLTQYLANGSLSLDEIILKDPLKAKLDIIVAGPVPPNPSELLQIQRLDDMFVQLRGMYDYIIIDSAPVGMVSDTFSLARLADVTVYVVRADYTRVSDVRFVNDMSKNNRLPRISLVVNGTRTKKGYGYGYGQNERKR